LTEITDKERGRDDLSKSMDRIKLRHAINKGKKEEEIWRRADMIMRICEDIKVWR